MDDRSEKLREIARRITEDNLDLPRWNVGDVVEHPDGFPVRILRGSLWQDYADGGQRLVNQWVWIRLDSRGNEIGREMSGEGWVPDPLSHPPSVGH